MPELPEVETVARKLRPKIINTTCRSLTIKDHKLLSPPCPIQNHKIASVERLGKEILLEFSSEQDSSKIYLLIHLRMTGRLLLNSYENHSRETLNDVEAIESESYLQNKIIRISSDNHTKHIRAIFSLDNALMYFYDVRRFGTFKWSTLKPVLPGKIIDPVLDQMTKERLKALLVSNQKCNVKSFLLRQDKITGIGNIYASEILHRADIHPERICGSLKDSEIEALCLAIPEILNAAIENNGTTFLDFQHDDAEIGMHQNHLLTYNREGQACKTCGHEIFKITQQQRSTYFCGYCQK